MEGSVTAPQINQAAVSTRKRIFGEAIRDFWLNNGLSFHKALGDAFLMRRGVDVTNWLEELLEAFSPEMKAAVTERDTIFALERGDSDVYLAFRNYVRESSIREFAMSGIVLNIFREDLPEAFEAIEREQDRRGFST